jgi:hypothetical protein
MRLEEFAGIFFAESWSTFRYFVNISGLIFGGRCLIGFGDDSINDVTSSLSTLSIEETSGKASMTCTFDLKAGIGRMDDVTDSGSLSVALEDVGIGSVGPANFVRAGNVCLTVIDGGTFGVSVAGVVSAGLEEEKVGLGVIRAESVDLAGGGPGSVGLASDGVRSGGLAELGAPTIGLEEGSAGLSVVVERNIGLTDVVVGSVGRVLIGGGKVGRADVGVRSIGRGVVGEGNVGLGVIRVAMVGLENVGLGSLGSLAAIKAGADSLGG